MYQIIMRATDRQGRRQTKGMAPPELLKKHSWLNDTTATPQKRRMGNRRSEECGGV